MKIRGSSNTSTGRDCLQNGLYIYINSIALKLTCSVFIKLAQFPNWISSLANAIRPKLIRLDAIA